MASTLTIHQFTLGDTTDDQLDDMAESLGVSRAEVVRRAVELLWKQETASANGNKQRKVKSWT